MLSLAAALPAAAARVPAARNGAAGVDFIFESGDAMFRSSMR